MSRTLADTVVAVIGATGGLGAPVSRLLAERGARLVVVGRHADRLGALDLPGAVAAVADLRDARAGDTVVRAALDAHGRLDGVVNCAGVVAFGPLVDTDDVIVEELFLTNVLGPLWLTRRVAPALAATKGFIANVSAVVADAPLPGMAAYAASKAALSAADRALARELRRDGITVIDLRPPHTETGLATRPIAGEAPRLPVGLDPAAVAARIVAAIEAGETDVPAAAFAPPARS
jgi:short-subunit dehydrogenase